MEVLIFYDIVNIIKNIHVYIMSGSFRKTCYTYLIKNRFNFASYLFYLFDRLIKEKKMLHIEYVKICQMQGFLCLFNSHIFYK